MRKQAESERTRGQGLERLVSVEGSLREAVSAGGNMGTGMGQREEFGRQSLGIGWPLKVRVQRVDAHEQISRDFFWRLWRPQLPCLE